jgi:hypothetical protein
MTDAMTALKNSQKCYYLRVFAPPTRAPHHVIRSLYAMLPPYNLFPPELNKFKICFAIGSLISAKKVRFSAQQQQQPQSQHRSTAQQQRPPHPVLGVIVTKTSPYSDLLYNAIHFVCVKHNTCRNIFGTATERISIALHEQPQDVTVQTSTPLPEHLAPPTLLYTTLTILRSYAMSPSTPRSLKNNNTSIVPSTHSAPAMASSTSLSRNWQTSPHLHLLRQLRIFLLHHRTCPITHY